jgi:YidC/Oxa1 family membrane protein insertase
MSVPPIVAAPNPFGFLEPPLESFLTFLNDQGKLTLGWSIVALTVVVRIIILPLFVSQYRSARRMQQVSPLLQQIKKKYANDKRKQQEEMMKLFQEQKVNPFGSCLPILVQAPVFIALFFVLRDYSEENPLRGEASFMWIIPDVSQEFRSMGWQAGVLAVIYGVSQLLATEVSFATSPQTTEWQRKLFRVIPVFIVGGLFLYPDIPAGLVLYWLTTNLWTCGQQVVLKRRMGPLQPMAVPELPPEPPVKATAKPGGSKPAAAKSRPAKAAETTPATEGAPAEGPRKPKPKPSGARTQGSSQRRRPPKKR